MNLETWRRIARVDLLDLTKELSSASMETLKVWPSTGEGRRLKEACEKAVHDLHGSNSMRLARGMRDIEVVSKRILSAVSNEYFNDYIAPRKLNAKKWKGLDLGAVTSSVLDNIFRVLETEGIPEDTEADFTPRQQIARPERRRPPSIKTPAGNPLPPTRAVRALAQSQNVEAIQFGRVGGQLRVHDQPTGMSEGSPDTLELMRIRLLRDAEWLTQNLVSSNVDRRTTSVFADIIADLGLAQNIVQLGIGSLALGEFSKRYIDEIGEPVSAKWRAFAMALDIYVGHFDTWRKLVEHASEIEWEPADAEKTKTAAKELVHDLSENKGLADPKVPRSIEHLVEAASLPGRAGKRALYSLIRTLENFVSYAVDVAAKLGAAVLDGTTTAVKRTTATTATIALLTIAGNVAIQASPSARKILKSDWAEKAEALSRVAKEFAE